LITRSCAADDLAVLSRLWSNDMRQKDTSDQSGFAVLSCHLLRFRDSWGVLRDEPKDEIR